MEFFERHQGGERAILVHLDLKQQAASLDEDLEEFLLLAKSAGAEILATVTGSRQKPDARLYAGSGKVAEIAALVQEKEAELVLFNHSLTPAQERNLEKELQCRVLDRTGLILDIFAQRAQTFEGKLQVELAQLSHLSSRLVRGWTHLERQKGGIGLRGPGETQLETDRRLLKNRVTMLSERLEKVRQNRQQGRASRQKAAIPTVSLVGYTNAGKSTLFNRVTHAEVYADDRLFATLDPTLRRIDMPSIGPVVLVDTVGFVRHLPHQLVEAFRATLEETLEADLLMHVVDAASAERDAQIEAVNEVLHEIGSTTRILMVYNKIDLMGSREPRIDVDDQGLPVVVWMSAMTGIGVHELKMAVTSLLVGDLREFTLTLPPEHSRLRAKFYELGAVLSEDSDEDGVNRIRLRLTAASLAEWLGRNGIAPETVGLTAEELGMAKEAY
ncbi:GTP-binding protein HflX [Fluviicoccus keumensis]|uniref:GTPase HflX n=1 Tax=Fluviicoccus keumensis TaxID=1435465 RepID=A0A4Q7ZAT0_9GAMM|nr:ribosome rescue GTPase HflX [Fluviicoccus keumensis]RZU47023.1 GTP-binding protein HflX [Fluviicoccus keumensis]